MRKFLTLTLALALAVSLGIAQEKGKGGKGKGGGKGFSLPPKLAITIAGFQDGGMIPAKYAGNMGVSPAISWSQVPMGTQSFVLLMHDPDPVLGRNPSPDVTHWLVYNIPGNVTMLPEGVPVGATMANGAMQAPNTGNQPGYLGPAPPAGHGVHHYTFEMWALDSKIDVPATGNSADIRQAVMDAMKGHILTKGLYIGLYENK